MSLMSCISQKSDIPKSNIDESYSRIEPELYTSGSSSSGQCLTDQSTMMNTGPYRALASDYKLVTAIGGGQEEAVCISVAKHIPTEKFVAIRRVQCEEADDDLKIYQHEIISAKIFNHPNILPLYSSFVCYKEIWAVMPYMAYGSCSDLLVAHFKDGLSELTIALILRDILLALEYIHQADYIHRAVRASHILISANGHVCLSGLRYLYHMHHGGKNKLVVHDFPMRAKNGLAWLSPEILEQNLSGYDTKSDIYSLGITACELANGQEPFGNMHLTQMLYEKLNGTTPKLLDSTTLPEFQGNEEEGINVGTQMTADSGIGDTVGSVAVPAIYQRTFSQHFHHFVELCLQSDSADRPTAAQLLHHSFFKPVKKKVTESCLPDLLLPVTPLTDLNKLPKDDSAVDFLVDQMSEADLVAESWLF